MKSTVTLFLSTIVFITFSSCHKSSSGGSQGSVTGTWKFISVQAQTVTTVSENLGGAVGQAVTTLNFTSTNNAGTIQFTTDSMIISGLTYTIADSATVVESVSGITLNSSKMAYNYTLPVVTSTAAYQVIGKDSLYFPGGAAFVGAGLTTGSSGATYALNGTTLTLTSNFSQNSTVNEGGTTANAVETGKYIITLQKQQ